ncbi:hypothetical protein BCR33DRAFT_848677 [Rhizoclosmatium globosum]|uniref:DUF4246 domain-containing protein n=1 Tax=Rhizoclosmatium globosum TaxID=329046 RepID=A0A1Y2CK18_9FUNG|nr:hypothetical protein BCR33DRAFT_848677 [Rhizoclosmatium globosum]|eukprot:ORY47307.1 hypothetical protein BCR33DRAFT_848677 [Rhizoclosmatium globosum]
MKPQWWTNLADEALISRWKEEARRSFTSGGVTNKHFVNQAVESLLRELCYIAYHELIRLKTGGVIAPTSIHGVFISDCISESVTRLATYTESLETESLKKKKWREGSDGKVLDLIHPSEYCLVYGRSLRRDNVTQPVGSKPIVFTGRSRNYQQTRERSPRFQWLPSEFDIGYDGRVKLRSYINNLNVREYPELQDSIRSVFESMVPMFEATLGSLQSEPSYRISELSYNGNIYERFEVHQFFQQIDERLQKTQNQRRVIPGLPKSYNTPLGSRKYILAGRNVQVIVKMANIQLTPENPVFHGGNWHMEGMEYEAIVAVGLVYYSVENITQSTLAFYKGEIETLQGRCVVFPNHLPHRVKPFALQDKTRPGYRKILAFFFVDPDTRILSTSDVGIQQADWLAEELFDTCGIGAKLPYEVVRQIALFAGAMTEIDALIFAHEIMEERKNGKEEAEAMRIRRNELDTMTKNLDLID